MTLDSWLIILAMIGYMLEIMIVGVAIFPGVALCYLLWGALAAAPMPARLLWMCWGATAAYFIYGLTLILLVGLLRMVFRLRLREGEHSLRSIEALAWAAQTALRSPVSITFLNVLLLTPFASAFYRVMGAAIGRNVQINSKFLADPSLLEIGDNTVIGGQATILGHTFERGRLILRKVSIGSGVVVGLNAIVLPGARIGDGATIAAGAVVPKGLVVAAGSVYLTAPAAPDVSRDEGGVEDSHPLAPPPTVVEMWR